MHPSPLPSGLDFLSILCSRGLFWKQQCQADSLWGIKWCTKFSKFIRKMNYLPRFKAAWYFKPAMFARDNQGSGELDKIWQPETKLPLWERLHNKQKRIFNEEKNKWNIHCTALLHRCRILGDFVPVPYFCLFNTLLFEPFGKRRPREVSLEIKSTSHFPTKRQVWSISLDSWKTWGYTLIEQA